MIERGHYHLAGVAGVGMSALAQALAYDGRRVTGSDRFFDQGQDLDVFRKLRASGVALHPQDGSGLTAGTRALVFSTAVEKSNPDMAAAARLGVPLRHRSETLADLVAGRRCIAVTGTCGKSTVTGMLGWMLQELGADPTVVNGAPVVNWMDERAVGNTRRGGSDLWVIEADESDRSLLNYRPDWAVITNASKDHFDLDETLRLFERFAAQATRGHVGLLRDPGLTADLDVALTADGSVFRLDGEEFRVPVPGRHNAENAAHAAALCRELGYGAAATSRALRTFRGIHRRLERIGSAGGVTVMDDYAHNPAKILAAWRTVAPHHRRVFTVWRPHGYGPLASMMEELTAVFAEIGSPPHQAFVLPVFDAGGTANRSVSSDDLVERVRRAGCPGCRTIEPAAVPSAVTGSVAAGDLVMTMGARDPWLPSLARTILDALRARHG